MFSQAILAALCLASATTAHMTMSKPVPYGLSTLDNSPLLATGADFPCKQRSGVYDAEGAMNVMPLGSTQPLTFVGGATHGGGSCQVSITYDANPTKSSVWKVIHSIEGGCPVKGQAGNIGDDASSPDPDTYSFTVPTSLPTGNATLAWTWFNKVGNREMYMNCAPISLTASSSKRSEDETLMVRDQAAYNALPDMFVANIGNGCGTQDSTDLLFPAPGDSVEQDGLQTSSALATPTGNCQAPTAGASATAGGSAAAASSPASPATSAPAAVTSAPAAAAPPASGGIFATVQASAPAAAATTSAPAAAVSTPAAAPAPAAVSTPVAAAPPPASSSSSSSSVAGAMTAGTACSPEGTWNCIGGTSYQRCASGMWSVVQQMAAGTTCSSGAQANIDVVAGKKMRREVRFSPAHVRRHAQMSF
ncbi:hypothetical protein B7463_g1107, partial [Scytalidium lignicola]